MTWHPGEMMTQKILRAQHEGKPAWWIRTTRDRLILVRHDSEIIEVWK